MKQQGHHKLAKKRSAAVRNESERSRGIVTRGYDYGRLCCQAPAWPHHIKTSEGHVRRKLLWDAIHASLPPPTRRRGRACSLSCMAVDPCLSAMPGRSTSGSHRAGSSCLHQAQRVSRILPGTRNPLWGGYSAACAVLFSRKGNTKVSSSAT